MGSTGFVLTLAHIGGKRFTRACPDGVLVIGRSTKAELQIVDATISSLHARLTVQGGRAWVEDLTSKNGTWHDGRRLPPGEIVEVPAGGVVRLGELFDLAYGEGPLPESEQPNPFAYSFESGEGDQTADNPPAMFSALRAQSGEIHSPTGQVAAVGAAGFPPSPYGSPYDAGAPSGGSSFPEPPSVSLPWLQASGLASGSSPTAPSMPAVHGPFAGGGPPASPPMPGLPAAPPMAAAPAPRPQAPPPQAPPPQAAPPQAAFLHAPIPAGGAQATMFQASSGGPVPARRPNDAAEGSVKGRIVFGRGSDVVEFSSSAQHPTRNPAKPGTATMVQLGTGTANTRPGRAAADAAPGPAGFDGPAQMPANPAPTAYPAAAQPPQGQTSWGPPSAPAPPMSAPPAQQQAPQAHPMLGGNRPAYPQSPPGPMAPPPAAWSAPSQPGPSPMQARPAAQPAPGRPAVVPWGQEPQQPPRAPWSAPEAPAPMPRHQPQPLPMSAPQAPAFSPRQLDQPPSINFPSRPEPLPPLQMGNRVDPAIAQANVRPAYPAHLVSGPVASSDSLPPLAIPRHVRNGDDFALPTSPEEDEEENEEIMTNVSDRRRQGGRKDRSGRDAGGRGRRRRRKGNGWMLPLLLVGGLLVLGGVVFVFLKAVTREDTRPLPAPHRRAPAEVPGKTPPRRAPER